jgi:UDP-N-acetylglucosamine 2-epimerase (non-hydrolysing)
MASLPGALERAAYARLGLEPRGYLLVTLHRPALVDQADLLARTVAAIAELGARIPVVFPVHPRTRDRMFQLGLSPDGGVHLVDPQPYSDFVSLMASAAGVVTDSGGVQEETTVLGVPCFTLRDSTERPVTISHGTNTLLGLEPERLTTIPDLLGDRHVARIPALWDGRAGERAAVALERFLGVRQDVAVGGPLLRAAVARRPD